MTIRITAPIEMYIATSYRGFKQMCGQISEEVFRCRTMGNELLFAIEE